MDSFYTDCSLADLEKTASETKPFVTSNPLLNCLAFYFVDWCERNAERIASFLPKYTEDETNKLRTYGYCKYMRHICKGMDSNAFNALKALSLKRFNSTCHFFAWLKESQYELAYNDVDVTKPFCTEEEKKLGKQLLKG